MKELFKNLKSYTYPLKTKYGYGYIINSYNKNKADRRKVRRYIKHYGFDISETWNLDTTIMQWLSDNVGGFFRECGSSDIWADYDINGNEWSSYNKETLELDSKRHTEYQYQLKQYLLNCSNKDYKKFVDFVIPRLKYLSQHTNGYPANFTTFEKWGNALTIMINELPTRNVQLFIENFYALWD